MLKSVRPPHWIMLGHRSRLPAEKTISVHGRPLQVLTSRDRGIIELDIPDYNYANLQGAVWVDFATGADRVIFAPPPFYPELDRRPLAHESSTSLFANPLNVMARLLTPLGTPDGVVLSGRAGQSRYTYGKYTVEHEFRVPFAVSLRLRRARCPPTLLSFALCPNEPSLTTLHTRLSPGDSSDVPRALRIIDTLLHETPRTDSSLFQAFRGVLANAFPEIKNT